MRAPATQWVIAGLAVAGGSAAALAEEKVTVQSLLGQGYQIASAFTTPAGAGIMLQSKEKLFFCLVSETSSSAEVTTRYCKPVR